MWCSFHLLSSLVIGFIYLSQVNGTLAQLEVISLFTCLYRYSLTFWEIGCLLSIQPKDATSRHLAQLSLAVIGLLYLDLSSSLLLPPLSSYG